MSYFIEMNIIFKECQSKISVPHPPQNYLGLLNNVGVYSVLALP